MAKTVKELADELGISKSGIRKYLNASFREEYTFKNANRILIKEAGIQEIKGKIGTKNAHKMHTDNAFGSALESGESAQFGSALIKQLQEKDAQIARLQKLLDQSQQLQLIAENKIKKLESKTTDESSKEEDSQPKTETSNVEQPISKDERGFWSRLFNRKN